MQSVQGSGINCTADGNLTQSFKMGSLARMSELEDYNLQFWSQKLSFYRELILRVGWRGIFSIIVLNKNRFMDLGRRSQAPIDPGKTENAAVDPGRR